MSKLLLINFQVFTKRKGHTLHINRGTSADSTHVKLMYKAVKHLIDGTMDKVFSKDQWNGFVKTPEKKKLDSCQNCGCKFKPKLGAKKHNCKVYADNLQSCPKIMNSEKKLNKRRISKNVSFATPENHNKDKNIEVVNDYVHTKFPGREIKDVVSDGSCLPRALSLILFATQGHWTILARAINKFMIESWKYLLSTGTMIFPMKKIVKGNVKLFTNEKEFLDFLKTDESLYLWREHHDIAIIADLLSDVILTKNNTITGHINIPNSVENKSKIIEYHGESITLMLDTGKDHYNAIVHPGNIERNIDRYQT